MWKITDDGKKKTSELIKECKKHFDVYCYWDDKELDEHFPVPKESTTRYFNETIEAEDEKGKSYKDLKDPENYCTLRERLLMEIAYFKDTGRHLDVDNWTLCAGSRTAGGYVPGVHLYGDGKVYVNYWHLDYASDDLRFRRTLSLSPSPTSSLDSAIDLVKKAWYQVIKIM